MKLRCVQPFSGASRSTGWAVVLLGLFLPCLACGGRGTPPPPGGSPAAPAAEASSIAIPVEIPLSTLRARIEEKVPVLLREKGFEGEPENVRYTLTRGQISLEGKDGALQIVVPVQFNGTARPPGGGAGPGPGGPLRQAIRARQSAAGGGRGIPCEGALTLTFSCRLTVQSDWTLVANTRAVSRTWTRRCVVSPLQVDVTDKIDRKVEEKLPEILRAMNERIAQAAELPSRLQKAWANLQRPVSLEKGMWLSFNPERISLQPEIRAEGDAFRAVARVSAFPRVESAATPPPAASLPLPANSVSPAGDAFHLVVEARLPYDEAGRRLQSVLAGKVAAGGRNVQVVSTRAYGSGENLVVVVGVEGDVNATLSLFGRPRLDAAAGLLTIEGLDFTVDTANVLAGGADWLLHGDFRQILARKAKVPLTDFLAQAKARLEQGLNRTMAEGGALSGQVEQLTPLALHVTDEAVLFRIAADGRMKLTLVPPSGEKVQ